eukprot:3199365-Rhodomonas_salina.1
MHYGYAVSGSTAMAGIEHRLCWNLAHEDVCDRGGGAPVRILTVVGDQAVGINHRATPRGPVADCAPPVMEPCVFLGARHFEPAVMLHHALHALPPGRQRYVRQRVLVFAKKESRRRLFQHHVVCGPYPFQHRLQRALLFLR